MPSQLEEWVGFFEQFIQVCVLPLVSCQLFWPHRQCHPDFRPFLTIPLFVPLWWQRFLLPRIAPTPLSWNKRNTTEPYWHPTGMNKWYCPGTLPRGQAFTWNPWHQTESENLGAKRRCCLRTRPLICFQPALAAYLPATHTRLGMARCLRANVW